MPKKTGTKSKVKAEESQPIQNTSNYFKFGESYTSLILGIVVVIISTVLLLSFVNNKNANRNNTAQQQISSASVSATPTSSVSATPTMMVVTPDVTKAPTVTPTAKPTSKPEATATPTKTVAKQVSPTTQPKQEKTVKGSTYTIVAGDTLWKISEKVYNDGYKWTEIARANNLNEPSVIHIGNKLKLPKVDVKNTTSKIAQEPKGEKKAEVLNSAEEQKGTITGSTYTIVKGDDLWDIAVRAYGDGYKWTEIARANNLNNAGLIHAGNKIKIPRD